MSNVIFVAGKTAGAMIAKYLVEKAKEKGKAPKTRAPTKQELEEEILRLRDLIEEAVENDDLEALEDEVDSWDDDEDDEDDDE